MSKTCSACGQLVVFQPGLDDVLICPECGTTDVSSRLEVQDEDDLAKELESKKGKWQERGVLSAEEQQKAYKQRRRIEAAFKQAEGHFAELRLLKQRAEDIVAWSLQSSPQARLEELQGLMVRMACALGTFYGVSLELLEREVSKLWRPYLEFTLPTLRKISSPFGSGARQQQQLLDRINDAMQATDAERQKLHAENFFEQAHNSQNVWRRSMLFVHKNSLREARRLTPSLDTLLSMIWMSLRNCHLPIVASDLERHFFRKPLMAMEEDICRLYFDKKKTNFYESSARRKNIEETAYSLQAQGLRMWRHPPEWFVDELFTRLLKGRLAKDMEQKLLSSATTCALAMSMGLVQLQPSDSLCLQTDLPEYQAGAALLGGLKLCVIDGESCTPRQKILHRYQKRRIVFAAFNAKRKECLQLQRKVGKAIGEKLSCDHGPKKVGRKRRRRGAKTLLEDRSEKIGRKRRRARLKARLENDLTQLQLHRAQESDTIPLLDEEHTGRRPEACDSVRKSPKKKKNKKRRREKGPPKTQANRCRQLPGTVTLFATGFHKPRRKQRIEIPSQKLAGRNCEHVSEDEVSQLDWGASADGWEELACNQPVQVISESGQEHRDSQPTTRELGKIVADKKADTSGSTAILLREDLKMQIADLLLGIKDTKVHREALAQILDSAALRIARCLREKWRGSGADYTMLLASGWLQRKL